MKHLVFFLLSLSVFAQFGDPRWSVRKVGPSADRPASCKSNRDVFVCTGSGCSPDPSLEYCIGGTFTPFPGSGGGSGTVTNTGTLTANLPIFGNGSADVTAGTRSGNTTQVVTTTGTQTSGRCVEIDANGNHIAASASCGSGGGGGGLVLVEQHTASTSASLDFTTCITSTYDTYKIVLNNILPATNNAQVYFKVSTNGGSTWVGGTDYTWSNFRWNGGGTVPSGSGGTVAQIALNTQQSNSASSQGFSAVIYLADPLSTTRYKNVQGTGTGETGSFDGFLIYGGYNSTTAVNAFQVLMSSGDIASGTVRCYGVEK